MKISDKALKLIGRIILGGMDSKTNAPTHTVSTPQTSARTAKAPVLPFPKKDSDA